MVLLREGGMAALGAVHLQLVGAEPLNHGVGGVEGVHACVHLAHVRRAARDRDPGPDDADLGGAERREARPRLGDQARVGARQGMEHGERAVAGALLLDDSGELHLGRGLEPGPAKCCERTDEAGETCLHVGGAAAIHSPCAHVRLEGRRGPEVRGTLGHHIHVSLQHEGSAGPLAWRVYGDDVVPPCIGHQGRRPAGEAGKLVRVGRHAAGHQAEALVGGGHFVERARLLPEQAAMADKPRQQRLGLVADAVHGVQDCPANAGITDEVGHTAS